MKPKYIIITIVVVCLLIILTRQSDTGMDPIRSPTQIEPQYQTPVNLLLYTQKGSVNDSIEVFFGNVYVDNTILSEFIKYSGYNISVYKEGIKNTMGTRFNIITGFEVHGEKISKERAVVTHTITFDYNMTITDASFFIQKNGRWYFDLEQEMNPEKYENPEYKELMALISK